MADQVTPHVEVPKNTDVQLKDMSDDRALTPIPSTPIIIKGGSITITSLGRLTESGPDANGNYTYTYDDGTARKIREVHVFQGGWHGRTHGLSNPEIQLQYDI